MTIEELELENVRLGHIIDTVNTLNAQQADTIRALTDNQGIRRRTNRSMSVKGVNTYEGTLESVGWTREEHDAEFDLMDAKINELKLKHPEIAA